MKKFYTHYKKGFVTLLPAIIIATVVGTAGYFALYPKIATTTPVTKSQAVVSVTPGPGAKVGTVAVVLGQQFTLTKGQVGKVTSAGLEIIILEFFNSPCPSGAECIWSGVGISFEYRLGGEVRKGMDLLQVFGYKTKIVKTDYKTYANLIIEKLPNPAQAPNAVKNAVLPVVSVSCLPDGISLDDVVSIDIGGANKITVEQKLLGLKVVCTNRKLVDPANKEIYFYHLTGCWGAIPYNYEELMQKQRDEIIQLQKTYNVIEMTCNPLGAFIL